MLAPMLVSLIVSVSRTQGSVLSGDDALMDLQVKQAMSWHLSLGVYDRYGWHHPGPVYLYLISLVERFTGRSNPATAQLATATFINMACCAVIIVVISRRFGLRAGAATSGALLLCIAALNPALPSDPWTPNVVVLPLVLFGVVASLTVSGSGSLNGLSWCAVIATFAVQTDLSTTPLVAVVGGSAVAASLYRWIRPSKPATSQLRSAAAVVGLAVALWIPPVIQQLDGHPGNLGQIWEFFAASHGHPTFAFAIALTGSAASAALGFASPQLRLQPTPGQHEFVLLVVLLLVLTVAGASVRRSVLPLVAFAWLGLGAALFAATQLVGMPWKYLLTWTTVPIILAAIAAAVILASRDGRAALTAVTVLGCSGLVLSTTAVVRHSPQLTSRDVTVAAAAIMESTPAGQTLGLVAYDLNSLLDIEGVADDLASKGRTFDVRRIYRFEYPNVSRSPSQWAVLASTPAEIPGGYRLIAQTPDLYIAVGNSQPPAWN